MKINVRQHAWLAASLALLVSVPSGVAWAGDSPQANTVGSSDIIDKQVKYPDLDPNAFDKAEIGPSCLKLPAKIYTCYGIVGNAIDSAEVADNTLKGADVLNNSLAGADVLDNSLGTADIAANGVGSSEVANNSLTGDDINESTLNVGPRIRARADAGPGNLSSGLATVGGTLSVPAGTWLIQAKVNAYSTKYDPANEVLSATCVLKFGSTDLDVSRVWGDNDYLGGSPRGGGTMSMIGWATGAGSVSVQCQDQATGSNTAAQMQWHQLRIVAVPLNALN